jgi:tRNA pseudouridine55 synthase
MGRRRAGRNIDGVILLDKPAGITSNAALQSVRRLLGARKAGHTGSLDPFATGMLPICLGEASKTAAFMLDADKVYDATALLGQSTDTGDVEGRVTSDCAVPELDPDRIETAFARFRGTIQQLPPMHSALKQDGQPLYRLARKGIVVERSPRRVTIHRLQLVEWAPPQLRFEVECSKGTYVRTLAEDLARALGTCAHLVALRRLSVSPFAESGMVTFEKLQEAVANGTIACLLLPADAGLARWPVVRLGALQSAHFRHGRAVPTSGNPGWVRVHGEDQHPLGLGEIACDGLLQPRRVFVADPESAANA